MLEMGIDLDGHASVTKKDGKTVISIGGEVGASVGPGVKINTGVVKVDAGASVGVSGKGDMTITVGGGKISV